jgi:hypothetical protein
MTQDQSPLEDLDPCLDMHFKFWSKVARYYNQETRLDAGTLVMYAQHSSEFSVEQLARAFKQYADDPKHQFMPRPGQLRQYLAPVLDSDSEAREITARIGKTIRDHGWMNEYKARQDIGEAGWAAIEAYGGWQHVCENHGLKLDPTQFAAQARGIVKAKIERQRAGIEPDRQIEHHGGDNRLNDVIAKLANEKGME